MWSDVIAYPFKQSVFSHSTTDCVAISYYNAYGLRFPSVFYINFSHIYNGVDMHRVKCMVKVIAFHGKLCDTRTFACSNIRYQTIGIESQDNSIILASCRRLLHLITPPSFLCLMLLYGPIFPSGRA